MNTSAKKISREKMAGGGEESAYPMSGVHEVVLEQMLVLEQKSFLQKSIPY